MVCCFEDLFAWTVCMLSLFICGLFGMGKEMSN